MPYDSRMPPTMLETVVSWAWRTCSCSFSNELSRALFRARSEEHTSELQSLTNLVCRLLLEKKNQRHWERERNRTRAARDQKDYDISGLQAGRLTSIADYFVT